MATTKNVTISMVVPQEMADAIDAYIDTLEIDDSRSQAMMQIVAKEIGFSLAEFYAAKENAKREREEKAMLRKEMKEMMSNMSSADMRKLLGK